MKNIQGRWVGLRKGASTTKLAELPQDLKEILKKEKFGYLSVSNSLMKPHLTPVIYIFTKGKVFVVTSRIAYKVKVIRQNEKVAFLVNSTSNKDGSSGTVQILGNVKIYTLFDYLLHLFKMLQLLRSYFKKYPEYVKQYRKKRKELSKNWRPSPLARVVIEILPTEITYGG
jgi:uncharacterized pyridoxamine 5'-phosphate oxidase family protein